MLKLLVAIDHTLESNFALRAACRLARGEKAGVVAFHVLDLSTRPMDHGVGWAIHAYTRERIREAYLDMAGVIASESDVRGVMPDLKVVYGNVVKEIVREVSAGSFDCLFMGSVHPLEGPHKGILLKLLPKVSCPVVVLRHYRPFERVMLFAEDEKTADWALTKVEPMLQGLSVPLDVLCSVSCSACRDTCGRPRAQSS